MTERLFDLGAYLTEFFGKVISSNEKGVVLDRTLFFPEEGGQVCDKGTLGECNVNFVYEENGTIYHKTDDDASFSVGEEVFGKIDFDYRFSNMQNHSGEHIVSGIVHNKFGYDNIGFHLNDEEIALDFNGVLTEKEIRKVEILANQVVWESRNINISYPTANERENLTYRSKKEIAGELRLVDIEGIDVCACCAPHVRKTGEIGIIKIVNFEKHRGGTRVYILCGKRALFDYSVKQNENKKISVMLKVPEYETSKGVDALLKKKADAEYEITRLNIENAKSRASQYEKSEVIIAFENFSAQALTYFVNGIKEKSERCAVFSQTQDGSFQYIITGNKDNLREYCKLINEKLGGRGGGKPDFIQGNVSATKEEIEKFFDENPF